MRNSAAAARVIAGSVSFLSILAFVRCSESDEPFGGGRAAIALSETALSFSATATATVPSEQKTINVTNGGDAGSVTGPTSGFIAGLAASVTYAPGSATGWLDATLSGTTDPAQLTLRLTTTAVTPGTHRATVTISGQIANSKKPLDPKTVAVTYEVTPGPTISVTESSVDFATWAGGPNPDERRITISNTGQPGTTLVGLTAAVSNASGNGTWLKAAVDPSGASATLRINAVATGLVAGKYTGTVSVSSAVTQATKSIDVTFNVGPGPKLGITPSTAVSFTALAGKRPVAEQLTITNVGGGELTGVTAGTITYPSGVAAWLDATLASVAGQLTLTLQPRADVTALGAGSYDATIPITSSIFGVDPVNVRATMTLTPGPVIALNPLSVSFQGDVGGPPPATKDVAVTNGGGGSITGLAVGTVAYGNGATGWLTATLSSGETPSTLHLRPSRTNLNAGVTYTATVPITSSMPDVAPKQVSVTYTLREVPVIVVDPTSAEFSAVMNGAQPAAKNLVVSNAGFGSLGSLTTNITYQGTQNNWLSATITSGQNGGTLVVRPTTTALPIGTYSASVVISSSTSGVADAFVPVTYTVTPLVPVIQLDRTSAELSLEEGYDPTFGPGFGLVNITNATPNTTLSGLSASITYPSGPTGWLKTSLAQATAPTTLSIGRGIFAAGLTAGTYTATVTVSSSLPGVTSRTVGITFDVTPVPCIALSATSLTFNTTQYQDPAAQVVNVTNGCGANSLLTAMYSNSPFLGAISITGTLASSTAPTTLTVSPRTTIPLPVAPGTYNGSITIYVDNGLCCRNRDPKTVQITVNVAPGIGTVTVSPSSSTLVVNGTVQLSAAVQASAGLSTAVTWTSSNPTVASVSSTGLVRALAKGTATITARSTVDATKSGTASITVQ